MQQQPGLLTHKEEILQARLVGMAQLLRLDSLEAAAALCKREPALLVLTNELLQTRWARGASCCCWWGGQEGGPATQQLDGLFLRL